MKNISYSVLAYVIAILCGVLTIHLNGDAYFGVIGLLYAAMGAGFLDFAFNDWQRK